MIVSFTFYFISLNWSDTKQVKHDVLKRKYLDTPRYVENFLQTLSCNLTLEYSKQGFWL